jgi:outer membrane protein assembly factor BamB
VTVNCSPESTDECRIGTNGATDSEGRFVFWIDREWVEFPAIADVRASPPLGLGYVLGTTTVEGLATLFQRPPVADTTFVDLVLPPNSVDSRRPVRIQWVGHRTGGLRLDSERLYMSSPGGVAAMDQATGECLWENGATGGLAGPAYVLAEGVVVLARGATLTALRAVDGEVLWNREGAITRSLTAGVGGVFFASDAGQIVAYDRASGDTRWTHELIGSGTVEIAAGEGLVCAEILAFVECWEPSTGEPIWSRPTDFASWLAIAGDRVILGAPSGWTAFDGATGAELWHADIGTFNSPTLAESEDTLFACSSAECLAVRVSNGQLVWRVAVSGPGPPATDGEAVYVVSWEDGHSPLYVLEAATGAVREQILADPFDGGFYGTPAVSEDLLFVFGGFGNLYAFEKP